MASTINTFKSYAVDATTVGNTFYTTPSGTTTIVLLAQATNVGNSDANVTFYTSLNGNTEITKDFTIPVGDAASMLTGKLVLQAGNSMSVLANANSVIKLTVSILETT
jgi:hypothetical protein